MSHFDEVLKIERLCETIVLDANNQFEGEISEFKKKLSEKLEVEKKEKTSFYEKDYSDKISNLKTESAQEIQRIENDFEQSKSRLEVDETANFIIGEILEE